MNTGLWKMDSGLAAARRPGMTNGIRLVGLVRYRSIPGLATGAPASQCIAKIPIFIGPEAAGYQMQVIDADARPR
jgi:hypothetical protein